MNRLDVRKDLLRPDSLPSRAVTRRRRAELAFLPAALEVVETPPSPTARLTAGCLMLMAAVAIAWSCIGEVDIVTSAPGRIVARGRTKVIQPFETSVVSAIGVRVGEHVAAGQNLITLDPTGNAAERDRAAHDLMLARLDQARLHALLDGDTAKFAPPPDADAASVATARHLMMEQQASLQARLGDLDHQAAEKRAEIDETHAEMHRLDATMPMLEAHVRIRGQAMQTGFGNEIDYYDAMRELVDQQQQRVVDQSKLVENSEGLASIERQRAQALSDFRTSSLSDLSKAEATAAEKEQDLLKAAQLTRLQTLRAPVAGTVQEIDVHTVGGVVTPAQPLLTLVPDDSQLEIEAMVPNREVGFVHPGQAAEVKVETLEFTRYGLLHATVTSLSHDVASDPLHQGPSAASAADQSAHPGSSGSSDHAETPPDGDPDYIAHLDMRERGLQTEQGFVPLTPGMTVTAEIKTGRRRVIDYLLSPLEQYGHDAFTER
jgi:hemolysin D